jgi:hypothetical protein
MVTVLEECTTEEQRHIVRFLWAKGLSKNDIHKKCFLYKVGSICGVKRFTGGSRNVVDVSLMKKFKRRCGSG